MKVARFLVTSTSSLARNGLSSLLSREMSSTAPQLSSPFKVPPPPHPAPSDGWSSTFGWLVGQIDASYVFVRSIQGLVQTRPLLFPQGFGDMARVMQPYMDILARMRAGQPLAYPECPEPTFVPYERRKGAGGNSTSTTTPGAKSITRVELQMESPWAQYLPEEARTMRALWLSPEEYAPSPSDSTSTTTSTTTASPPEVFIHMPAFGEEGYSSRSLIAEQLSRAHGAVNLVLMAPFYSKRRRTGQVGPYLATVADMLLQANIVSLEAGALVRWALRRWPTAKVFITGFSYGGAMTGMSGLLVAPALAPADRARFGIVPCIGSSCPGVIASGVLSRDVDWMALQRDYARCMASEATAVADRLACPEIAGAADARSLLHAVLHGVHIRHLVDSIREGHRRAHEQASKDKGGADGERGDWLFGALSSVVAASDGFVPPVYTMDQYALLSSVTRDGSATIACISGGHVSSFIRRGSVFLAAVRAAVDILDRDSAEAREKK